ncbi:MAG: 50S ribosomal protein L37e [Candidatus Bathyarchaeota archaeon]|nr:50S ribosomal protein L37e [Candidatus Bathyarchaeota archaeon]
MPTKHALHTGKRIHIRCRRCGRRSYHVRLATCAACGYGVTSKLRHYNWMRKDLQRTHRLI